MAKRKGRSEKKKEQMHREEIEDMMRETETTANKRRGKKRERDAGPLHLFLLGSWAEGKDQASR
jgi:hypothetical protein